MIGLASLRTSLVVLGLAVCAIGAAAQGNSPQLVIVNAVPNMADGSLTITGFNFGASGPWVTFDGVPVPVTSSGDTQLVVMLPGWVTTTPGSYLLTVYRQHGSGNTATTAGPGDKRFAASFVTIGAVGPQGDKGDKGDQGEKGADGAQGEKGETGATGDKGDKGETGATGATGDKGDQGDKGDKGDRGDKGDKGDRGDKGDQGIPGPQGIQGIQGIQGLTGNTGNTGSQGPQGLTGNTGNTGAIGPQGIQGIQGVAGTSSWIDAAGRVNTNEKVGIGDDTFTPQAPLHVRRDVAGPRSECLLGLPNGVEVGCYALAFEPAHHAAIIENRRRSTDDTKDDMSLHNTGGLAVVLHSYDQFAGQLVENFHPLNSINSSDKFISFFRKNHEGTTKMAGRIQGISPTDLDDTHQWAASMVASLGSTFLNNFKVNFELHPFADWLKFTPPALTGGKLPRAEWHDHTSCEGDNVKDDDGVTWELEICSGFLGFDLDFDWGALPKLTDMSFDGSKGPIKKIEFGITDPDAIGALAQSLAEGLTGSVFNRVWGIYKDPVQAAVNHLNVTVAGAGVTYESGSGDYAEWLERKVADEQIMVADIVGVFGGKITRGTQGADHTMVVSVKPIVLGNMPPEGREKDYEKVAFMGQTPVKVLGRVRVGDFIVPSGREDGTGVAVNPNNITAAQLGSVVGVAWEENTHSFGIVNLAVGLKSSDIAKVIGRHETQMTALAGENEAMKQEMARIADLLETLMRQARQ